MLLPVLVCLLVVFIAALGYIRRYNKKKPESSPAIEAYNGKFKIIIHVSVEKDEGGSPDNASTSFPAGESS